MGMAGACWPSNSAVCGPEVVTNGAVTPFPFTLLEVDASLLEGRCPVVDGACEESGLCVLGLAVDDAGISIVPVSIMHSPDGIEMAWKVWYTVSLRGRSGRRARV